MALKVGIVGLSGIGTNHANCHAQDELADLVAVCDVVKEKADRTAEKFGAKAYYSLKAMLENEPDLDIVDVSTGGNENGSWHYEPAMQGLEAGKHVLVEKPLSNYVHEAREMVAKAEEKGVYLGCNLNHYFTPPAEQAKKYIEEGAIGEQIYCLHKMGFPGGERTYQPQNSPRVKGFPYFHVKAFLSHPFSVMRYFCGDVTHVQAFVNRPGFRKNAGDVMLSVNSIHLRFVNDCVGYLLSQRGDTTFGLGGWWSIEVGGTRGTFCIENCIEKVTFWPAPGTEGTAQPERLGLGSTPLPVVTHSGITDFGQTFPRRIHAFLEDITNKVPQDQLRASGRDALLCPRFTAIQGPKRISNIQGHVSEIT
ncbi:Gfo/Idh/MocA family oxidoreductase [Candidatus Poribacteria bacterium]|nr:Gfo/Idh/MocA family oxidoreductase [Candidatus Poribacteria bacterium]